MAKKIIIVESPAKARTITKFLDKDYTVMASMGHVRDLPSSKLGFDPENNFIPQYEISKDKRKVVADLKKQIDKDTEVFLATDEDREGEAISWHLLESLRLKNSSVKRIVFHEITESAIINALENPREVDQQLVNAQQARRILDRAVGYKLSPLLWKKIKPGLSAGRVQSVSVYILVEREREIRKFVPEEYWKIKAEFKDFSADLKKIRGKIAKVGNEEEAHEIETSVKDGDFFVSEIKERMANRNPSAPFTTSTIQQEASLKLGFSVKRTMVVAQQLYEGNFDIPRYSGGLITYMRTDSVVLAEQALQQIKDVIKSQFGHNYGLKEPRKYKSSAANAQEAHEAIRPVDFSQKPDKVQQHLSYDQFRLYSLIWKRALASQMTAAEIARTTINIEGGKEKEFLFEAQGQRVVFPGFLKIYAEKNDEQSDTIGEKDVILPKVENGQMLSLKDPKKPVDMEKLFTKPPPRYTEASLVKKLESEGIGRPSTYAPTISTIQDRGYVELTDEKKLKPTSIGEVVTDFLADHFTKIVNLGFTAEIERNFDRIAKGDEDWVEMMTDFYEPFHENVIEKDKSVSRAEVLKRRELGTDPESGKTVSVSVGRYGPMVQIGTREDEEKPRFASLPNSLNLNDVTLEEALECFSLPRVIGEYENGEEITANNGRYGPYVKLGKDFFSIPKDEKAEDIELVRAVELIREGLERKSKSVIHDFGEIQVLNGRYGPYIKSGKNNYKIPKNVEPEGLDEVSCKKIIEESPPKGSRRFKNKVSKDIATKKIIEESSQKGTKAGEYSKKSEQQVEKIKSQKM